MKNPVMRPPICHLPFAISRLPSCWRAAALRSLLPSRISRREICHPT